MDLLFAPRVKVYSTDGACALIEADVIESLETSAGNRFYFVVGNEKVFLPPHEKMLSLCKVLEGEAGRPGLLCERLPCREPSPMLHVYLFRRAPFGMCCLEGMFCADYLAFKAGRQCWVVVCKAYRNGEHF